MRILGVIPARYNASRFPGKPMADILGKTMIRRVLEQAKKAALLTEVVVATDDERILKEIERHQGRAVMTSDSHRNGTERCAEVLTKVSQDYDYVINIQGDEPLIDPQQIDMLAAMLNGDTQLGTLVKKITDIRQLTSDAVVKAVTNNNNEAIYFSRSVIPHPRAASLTPSLLEKHSYYKHIGIYGYRCDILKKIVTLEPSPLELCESLEQLRWLSSGYTIRVAETTVESPSVDTPEDLKHIVQILS